MLKTKETKQDPSTFQPLSKITVDYTFLINQFGTSGAPLRELLDLFLFVVEPEKELMKQYVIEKEWDAYSMSVHKIKSNLRFLGFNELLRTAEWLELAVIEEEHSMKLNTVITEFEKALEIAMEVVKNELSCRPHPTSQ